MRSIRTNLALLSLALPISFSSVPALAQHQPANQPSRATPLQSRSESRALVQKLLREGKVMRPSQARRGMRGYALSVFQGTKIERFNIEVLGTLERVQGGGDLVMIRVLDGPVIQRNSGIIQGMSGSPVYINGKLLGAIAIGFGFPKEPIGGVTPITQMIETGLPDNSARPKPVALAKKTDVESYRTKTPIAVANRQIERVLVSRDAQKPHFPDANSMTMRPCTRLVLLSGVSPSSLGRWKKIFEPYGVTPMIGGGAMSAQARQAFGIPSKKTGVKADLSPGAAIGVQLASGDIDATGVGTVSFRDGNRVLGFGHPMFNLGAVSMPMTTAYVHDIFPSYEISFKLASPIDVVGELQRDNNFSVGGTVGRTAQTIPLRIRITDADKKIDRRINVRLIKDPLFTPELLQGIAVEAVQSTLGLDSAKTVKVSLGIGLGNGPDIRRQNTTYAGGPVILGALSELLDAVSITQQNPFDKGDFKSIDLSVNVVPGRKTARIRRVFADRNRVKAGENLVVSVELEPTNAPEKIVTRRFTVPVPADTPKGVLRIAVSSGEAYWAGRSRVGGAPPRPNTLRELLDAYAKIGSSNSLLLQASTPQRFLLLDRKKVANPPALWNRIVPAAPSTSLGFFNEVVEQREASEWVLTGLEAMNIPVDSQRWSDENGPESPSNLSNDEPNSDVVTGGVASNDDLDLDEEELLARVDYRRHLSRWQSKLGFTRANFANASFNLSQITRPRINAPVNVATATPTPVATPSPTPSPTPEAGANGIARPVGRWIQRSATDFARGDFKNAVVQGDGSIIGGPASRLLLSSGEPVAWSVASTKNAVYVGTGYAARLLKLQNGEAKVIYEGPEVAISALTSDDAGNVYAGVSPGGRVYRFAPDGTRTTILRSGESFVHAFAWQNGQLLVATGGEKGGLYKVASPASAANMIERAQPFVTFDAKHARSISVAGDEIFVGAGEDAVLYRVDAGGKATAIYQAGGLPSNNTSQNIESPATNTTVIVIGGPNAPGAVPNSQPIAPNFAPLPAPNPASLNEILAVCAVPRGDETVTYFGTLSSGVVWSYSPSRGVSELWKSPGRSIYSLALDGAEQLLVGTDNGEVWRVDTSAPTPRVARVLKANQPQILALSRSQNGVLAATASNAAVYEISADANATSTFTSNVFDAGQIVRFGALRSIGGGVQIETRSGNTLEPDATWSAFAPLENGQIVSPNARFLQYRATLSDGGTLNRVEAFFRAPNRTPRVSWNIAPNLETISGKKTLGWTASDPDADPLRAFVEISSDNQNWKPLELKNLTQSNLELDSSKWADGVYRLRVSVSDAARNPDEPLRAVAVSGPITLDNTAPKLENLRAEKTGEGWKITASGADLTSPLAGAEWRVVPADAAKIAETPTATAPKTPARSSASAAIKPAITPATSAPTSTNSNGNGTVLWQALGAADGIFDGKTESIVAEIVSGEIPGVKLEAGTKLEVRLRDSAGNSTTATVILP